MSLLAYKYYDTPEGQDIYKKTFCLTKWAGIAGVTLGAYDVLLYSHPKGFVPTAARMFFYLGPTVGMAAAFTVTTNVSQNIRGKNDEFNYFMGGAAASSVFTAWLKKPSIFIPVAVIFGGFAMAAKTAHDAGVKLFPDVMTETEDPFTLKRDFTLSKDVLKHKTWTTGEKA